MIKFTNKQVIEVSDLDELVEKTYGKPYSFQQQDGCKDRGTVNITVPSYAEDYQNDTIPEEVNGDIRGVSFAAWLARDPKEWNEQSWTIDLFWHRNFYPTLEMIVNDLHAKGLIPAGEYVINIDWKNL